MPRVVLEEDADDEDFPDVNSLLDGWKEQQQQQAQQRRRATRLTGMSDGDEMPPKKTSQRRMKSVGIEREDRMNEGSDDGVEVKSQARQEKDEVRSVATEMKKTVRKRVLKSKSVENPLLKPFVGDDVVQQGVSPLRKGTGQGLSRKDGMIVAEPKDVDEVEKPARTRIIRRSAKETASVGGVEKSRAGDVPDLKAKGAGKACWQDIRSESLRDDVLNNLDSTPVDGESSAALITVPIKQRRKRTDPAEDRGLETAKAARILPEARNYGKQQVSARKVNQDEEMCAFDEKSSESITPDLSSAGLLDDSPRVQERSMSGDEIPGVEKSSEKASEPERSRMPLDGSETDEECSRVTFDLSESDDMSDFIVNDSHVSVEDDSFSRSSPPPPPRSTRKLVRGRRPRHSDVSKSEEERSNNETRQLGRRSNVVILDTEKESVNITDIDAFYLSSDEKKQTKQSSSSTGHKCENDLTLNLAGLSLNDEIRDENQTKIYKEKGFTTPPGSPRLKPIKLKSPTKRFPTIPTLPHRPSMDSFWNQEAMTEWNDEYSPQKTLRPLTLDDSPIKGGAPLFSPSKAKSPVKSAKVKKAFEQAKHEIAQAFLLELDQALCQDQIARLSETTGGVKIIWSKKLNTTAGRANWKRETVKSCTTSQPSATTITYRHYASIELAEKVIDGEHRLLNVLAHEFCHLTNFMISNVKNNPHGKEFKSWAAKCTRLFGHRGIEVTTKHSYEIEYKYIWECENCGLEYKRHSKSIDLVKHRCGSCKATLVQTRPAPRGGKEPGTVKKITEYQTFVKENMKIVRQENPGSPQKDVMVLVAKRYKEYKASKSVLVENTDGVNSRNGNEGTPDINNTGDLVRKLDFLDLTSP